MSIFGGFSLCFLIALLIDLRRKLSHRIVIVSLASLIALQLFFVFRDAFLLFNLGNRSSTVLLLSFVAVIIILFVTIHNLLKLKLYKLSIVLIIIGLFLLIYTEYFNGVYSFKSISEFQSYNLQLKKYYFIVPYKLVNKNQINSEWQTSVYYLNFYWPTNVKRDVQGNLFYYKSRGFGDGGRWFQFGISEGRQILNNQGPRQHFRLVYTIQRKSGLNSKLSRFL
jgi:hypothetical protein